MYIRIELHPQLIRQFLQSCRELWLAFNFPSLGNCFVFNHLSNLKRDPQAGQRKNAFPGPYNGLILALNLQIGEYIRGRLTESSGALGLIQAWRRLFLHTYASLGFPKFRIIFNTGIGIESYPNLGIGIIKNFRHFVIFGYFPSHI